MDNITILIVFYLIPLSILYVLSFFTDDEDSHIIGFLSVVPLVNILIIVMIIGKLINFFISKGDK